MVLPPALPAEVTSLEYSRKRKHSDAVAAAGASSAVSATAQPTNGQDASTTTNPSPPPQRTIDDASSEDEQSLFETIIDQVELEPFVSDGSDGLSEDEAADLRALLRRVGVGAFVEQILASGKMAPRLVGVAFGVDPSLPVDEDTYVRILGLALMRAQYKRQKLEQYNTIDDVAQLLRNSHNIMVVTGAGISTSLGIPDFRSKGTGFYEKLRNLGYEDAEEVFEISNFDFDPSVFYSLAGDILPDLQRFSPTHGFIRRLQDENRLLTNYTQNIDNLEAAAGIEEGKLIQCHGSFATATCRKCKYKVPGTDIYQDIREKRVALCTRCLAELAAEADNKPRPVKRSRSKRPSANESDSDSDVDDDIPQPGVMKPDITFFGEQLPDTFFQRFTEHDAHATDLVLVIGTSLKVAPVSEMPNYLPDAVPHVYISREPIAHVNFDVQLLGNCDDVVAELCRRANWGELCHPMLPADHATDVLPVEGCGHRWVVVPKLKNEASEDAKHGDTRVKQLADVANDNAGHDLNGASTAHTGEATPKSEEIVIKLPRSGSAEGEELLIQHTDEQEQIGYTDSAA